MFKKTALFTKGTKQSAVIEELNVTPSTSAQTINAPAGTDGYNPINVSAVTSSIDPNIVAGNIKNGVSILGVVGTYSESSPNNGEFLVAVIDYDGSIIKQTWLNTGDTFEMPEAPTHTGLVFQGWSSPVLINNNKITVGDSDIIIGPMYGTVSGMTEFDMVITSLTGLNVTLNMTGTKDWGDGTIDTNTSHTYVNEGNYTIKCDGTFTNSYGVNVFGNDYTYQCEAIRVGSNVTTLTDCIFRRTYFNFITIPSTVTTIERSVFEGCYNFALVVIPAGITKIPEYSFSSTSGSIVLPYGITQIDMNSFSSSRVSYLSLPETLTSIGTGVFNNGFGIKRLRIPDNVTSLGAYCFAYTNQLQSVVLPSNLTTIEDSTFRGSSATHIKFPVSLTTIQNNAFYDIYTVREFDFSDTTQVPTLGSNNLDSLLPITKIKVPSALYNSWIATSGWSSLVDYIEAV